jgi:hypothetical protein
VGPLGLRGQAGRSRLRLSTAKRREAAQAERSEGAEASGLDHAARAGKVPHDANRARCGAKRKERRDRKPLGTLGKKRGKDGDRRRRGPGHRPTSHGSVNALAGRWPTSLFESGCGAAPERGRRADAGRNIIRPSSVASERNVERKGLVTVNGMPSQRPYGRPVPMRTRGASLHKPHVRGPRDLVTHRDRSLQAGVPLNLAQCRLDIPELVSRRFTPRRAARKKPPSNGVLADSASARVAEGFLSHPGAKRRSHDCPRINQDRRKGIAGKS